jgi:aspartate beta-hydroxylase
VLRLISKIAAHTSRPIQKLPKGSIEISTLLPGSHIKPHCGPTNHRLRIHLGLVIPKKSKSNDDDGRPMCSLVVGGEARTWEQDDVLVFDDSFEHEVWNNASSPRTVLIFDLWHPELSSSQRDEVRQKIQALY